MVTLHADKTARVWDAASGKPVVSPMHQDGWVNAASSARTGGGWSPRQGQDGAGVGRGERQASWPMLKGHEDAVDAAAVQPGRARGSSRRRSDKTARVWDAASGKPSWPCSRGTRTRSGRAAFSPDGQPRRHGVARQDRAGVGRDERQASWHVLKGHEDAVSCRSVSARTGSGSSPRREDKTARVWDAASGQAGCGVLTGHEGAVTAARVQPGRAADRHRPRGQDRAGVGRRRAGQKLARAPGP